MIVIDRDPGAPDVRYTFKAKEPGWGTCVTLDRLSIGQAKLATDHYFGLEHNKKRCPLCQRDEAQRARRAGRLVAEVRRIL